MIRGTRFFVLLAIVALPLATGGFSAMAQDDVTDPEASADAPADDEREAEDADESVDDDDAFIRDGVFTPSEKIEADSEISFPADI